MLITIVFVLAAMQVFHIFRMLAYIKYMQQQIERLEVQMERGLSYQEQNWRFAIKNLQREIFRHDD